MFRVFYFDPTYYTPTDGSQKVFFEDRSRPGAVKERYSRDGHLVGNPDLQLPQSTTDSVVRGVYVDKPRKHSASLTRLAVSFQADLISRRSYGSCYLDVPALYEVGVARAPESVKGAWPAVQTSDEMSWLNTTVNRFQITNWTLDLTRPLTRLSVDPTDSTPRVSANGNEAWTCRAKSGQNCDGGYVALLTPNAAGNLNEAILWRSTLLGVAASLFAASLLRFRRRALRARAKHEPQRQ
jgi:hypothetical protein